jgi:hypothetical protein
MNSATWIIIHVALFITECMDNGTWIIIHIPLFACSGSREGRKKKKNKWRGRLIWRERRWRHGWWRSVWQEVVRLVTGISCKWKRNKQKLANERGSLQWLWWWLLSLDHDGSGGGTGLLVIAFGRCTRWRRRQREREREREIKERR